MPTYEPYSKRLPIENTDCDVVMQFDFPNGCLILIIFFSGITGKHEIILLLKESQKIEVDKNTFAEFILSFLKSYAFNGDTRVSVVTYGSGDDIKTPLNLNDGTSIPAVSRAIKSIDFDAETGKSTVQDGVDVAINLFSAAMDTKKILIVFTNKKSDDLTIKTFDSIKRKNISFIPVSIGIINNLPRNFKNNLPDNDIIQAPNVTDLADVYPNLDRLLRKTPGKYKKNILKQC